MSRAGEPNPQTPSLRRKGHPDSPLPHCRAGTGVRGATLAAFCCMLASISPLPGKGWGHLSSRNRVICPHCGADNPPGARFCINCGQPLPRVCPTCGTVNPPAARFCMQCGAALDSAPSTDTPAASIPGRSKSRAANRVSTRRRVSAADPSEERRVVTVVFGDLANSTVLADRMDPEELRALLGQEGV